MLITDLIIAGIAALGAGFVNAIAGGGTLITFPTLIALGLPPITANITNTVALSPGFLGGTFAQRKDFQSQKQRLYKILPVCLIGGIIGGILLVFNSESSFKLLIPYLLLIATFFLAIQVPLKKLITSKTKETSSGFLKNFGIYGMLFLASIYGGYFGAGLGVILMAILGLIINESLTKLNVLKQAISFCINCTAAIYFSFTGKVEWMFAFVMVFGSISGGMIGGKLAGKINPEFLRWVIVGVGGALSVYYFWK
jgi:uncharacterized membrane protein YfcA